MAPGLFDCCCGKNKSKEKVPPAKKPEAEAPKAEVPAPPEKETTPSEGASEKVPADEPEAPKVPESDAPKETNLCTSPETFCYGSRRNYDKLSITEPNKQKQRFGSQFYPIISENYSVPEISPEGYSMPTIQSKEYIIPVFQKNMSKKQGVLKIQSKTYPVPAFRPNAYPVPPTQSKTNLVPALQSKTNVVPALQSKTNFVPALQSKTICVSPFQSKTNLVAIRAIQAKIYPISPVKLKHCPVLILQSKESFVRIGKSKKFTVPVVRSKEHLAPAVRSKEHLRLEIQSDTNSVPLIQEKEQTDPTEAVRDVLNYAVEAATYYSENSVEKVTENSDITIKAAAADSDRVIKATTYFSYPVINVTTDYSDQEIEANDYYDLKIDPTHYSVPVSVPKCRSDSAIYCKKSVLKSITVKLIPRQKKCILVCLSDVSNLKQLSVITIISQNLCLKCEWLKLSTLALKSNLPIYIENKELAHVCSFWTSIGNGIGHASSVAALTSILCATKFVNKPHLVIPLTFSSMAMASIHWTFWNTSAFYKNFSIPKIISKIIKKVKGCRSKKNYFIMNYNEEEHRWLNSGCIYLCFAMYLSYQCIHH